MSISAVNCTPIKPKVSFGRREGENRRRASESDNFQTVSELSDKVTEKISESDIKSPAAVICSITAAGAAAYAGGKKLTSVIDNSCFNQKLGSSVESGLKKVSGMLQNTAKKLNPPESAEKTPAAKQAAGALIGKLEKGARTVYKKLAYQNLPQDAENRASAALSNTAGTGAALFTLKKIFAADSDGDGVKDIMQKSRNVYTKDKTSYGDAIETAGVMSKLVQNLT